MKLIIRIMRKNERNFVLLTAIFSLILLIVGCKSQQAGISDNNTSKLDLSLFCKVWAYDKIIVDDTVYDEDDCIVEKRLALKDDNTYKQYYTKELECEDGEEGIWTYNKSSKTLHIESDSTDLIVSLESLSEDKLHVSFDEDSQHIEILLSPEN